jgi:DNA excision repair protein ERCC-3
MRLTFTCAQVRACAYLINVHERKGDKILVFCDNLYCLKRYAGVMKRNFVCGSVKQSDRVRLFERFKSTDDLNCLFLSSVGDSAIDLPTASVIIQIACTHGSRRQEAQRLGRILRPKPSRADSEEHNAFFYTLVSRDTEEVYYASKRQSFLIDQGYSFKVLSDAQSLTTAPGLPLQSKAAHLHLLAEVLASSEVEGADGGADSDDGEVLEARSAALAPTRTTGNSLAELSGATGMVFVEFSSEERQTIQERLACSSGP